MTPSFLRHIFRPLHRPVCRVASPARTHGGISAMVFLFGTALLTTGCQHRDTVDTSIDAAHAFMGGEASRLHPPTPGYDKSPPNIAFIPTTTPDFPSAEARAALTNRLEADRNTSQRIAASGGALPIGMVNPPPIPTRDGGSMTITSQPGRPDDGTPAASRGSAGESPTAPAGPGRPGPSLIYQPVSHAIPVHLPDPGQPPRPLLFPGFGLPDTIMPLLPDFEAAEPAGVLIRFQPETDHPAENQDDAFNTIISQRRHHRVIIRGFGTTLSARTSLNPGDQAQEIALALLRAKAVARHLASLGVPESDMRLSGEPLGDGVRVTYEANLHPNRTAPTTH